MTNEPRPVDFEMIVPLIMLHDNWQDRSVSFSGDWNQKPVKRYISQKVVEETGLHTWLECEVEFQDGTFGTITECR